MAETNVADTLVEYLSCKNVRHIFGVLAHTSFAIGDAIAKRPHMSFINAQHEGGAGNMALGYARATKQPAVCLVSAGGGATNIVTAVAQAHKESVPLFVISSDIDTAASVKGPYSSFHGMEHVRLFQPITKQSAKLERVEELGSLLDTLFRQTTRGRQGPVFLIVPEELGSNYPTALSIQADAKIALRAIIDGVKSRQLKANDARAQAIQRAKQAWKNDLDEKTAKSGLTYESVMKVLNELLTGNEILTTSGMTGDTLRGIDAVTPIIHAGEFRAIGTALATAMGVKLGRPDARVICVTGDGSFMMEQQELATATYHKIPVFVLILRNKAYGGMKRDQIKTYGGRVIGTELFIPDLPRLAELYGAKGFAVTRKEELRPVFQQALATDEFVVVDVKLD